MNLKFVTSNNHKFEEMKTQLEPLDVNLVHHPLKYAEIQADSMIDVARHSLSSLITVIDGNFLVEDAGLMITALEGFPGPYSSYVFQSIGNEGILRLMSTISDRSAIFVSVMGLYWEGEVLLFEGRCEGSIIKEIRGDAGFGYDPIFVPEEYEQTFAELSIQEKTSISHRSKSTDQLIEFLNN